MKKEMIVIAELCLLLAFCTLVQPAQAEGTSHAEQIGDAELAQELSNPIADLITIPIQMNYDSDIGRSDDGWKMLTNIQPVIPFDLTEYWDVITRTIIPVISQDDIFQGAGSQFGLGDINIEYVLFARGTHIGRCDLGCRADFTPAHGDG